MLPTHPSTFLSKTKSLNASNDTVNNSLLVNASNENAHQTLHDIIILFLTSMALHESAQFRTLDLADIMTRLSDFISRDNALLSLEIDEKLRLDGILLQLSKLISLSRPAEKSLSCRILDILKDFWKKCLLIDSDIYTFIHQDDNYLFGDLVIPNLLVIRSALNRLIFKTQDLKECAIYIPEEDCGSWNVTHYPKWLLPRDISISVRVIPNATGKNTMDLVALGQFIQLDLNAGIHPMLIVCRVGTELSSEHDDLSAIIKGFLNCWIHVEGIDSIFYCLLDTALTKNIDSISLDLCNWSPNINLPKMTLFHDNPWDINDALIPKRSMKPWSSVSNSVLESSNAKKIQDWDYKEEKYDLFSHNPQLKQLFSLWAWTNTISPLQIKKELQSIRNAVCKLRRDLFNIPNIKVFGSNVEPFRGVMFRFESCRDLNEQWKELFDNLSTRFIFSKLYNYNLSLISVQSKIFIMLEIFEIGNSQKQLEKLPEEISSLVEFITESYDKSLEVTTLVGKIPQLQYVHPMHLMDAEGDASFSELSLGGLIYTPELLRIASKMHPQVLLDVNPFQIKILDSVSFLDIKLARDSKTGYFCLALVVPESYDEFYVNELIQIIMETGKTLECSGQMHQVSCLIKDRIQKSEKKLKKDSNEPSVFGIFDSLFSVVESLISKDEGMDKESLSDSFNLC